MKHTPIEITRARLEAKIEELVALLDLVDGDENLEPYLADTDPKCADIEGEDSDFEPEETDENGDEQDCCRSEDSGARTAATQLMTARGWILPNA